jgi:hypothetical protein
LNMTLTVYFMQPIWEDLFQLNMLTEAQVALTKTVSYTNRFVGDVGVTVISQPPQVHGPVRTTAAIAITFCSSLISS